MAAKTTDDAKPKSKKKLIIVGALGAVLLLGGGVGGTYMLVKPASAATEEVKEPLVPGEVVALDAVSVNLTDGHYLKMALALQAVAQEGGSSHDTSAPDGSKALDLMIKQFSGRPMAELSNPEIRQKLQDELQTKIIEAYMVETEGVKHETVMGVYVTQFVMQ